MPGNEMKEEVKDVQKKERLFDQTEVNYTPVSMQLGRACAGCRWFEPSGEYYTEGSTPSCHLVYNWPQPIQPTGLCDRYEAYPAPEPLTQAPMQVVIVDPETIDMGSAELSKEVEDNIVRRVVDAIKSLGRKDDSETAGFKVLGNHWLAVYSNNFKDRDGEFFPESEIDAYIQRVDMGIVPKPELQVWHASKATAIGSADWVARHGHFTMAAGQFYGGDAAQTAKAYYTKHAKDTGISHGFTYPSKEFDGKQYRGFNTFEISLLPRGAEANWYTSLEGVKAMAIDEKKLAYLKEVFSEEHATRILADWDKRGKALEALDVEYKDFTGTPLVTETANKEAIERVNKSLVELYPELTEGSAEAVIAAGEAMKAVNAQKTAIATQDAVIADLQEQLKQIRAELALKPRAASTAAETVMPESTLSKEVQDAIKQQTTVKHPFWGTEVTNTP